MPVLNRALSVQMPANQPGPPQPAPNPSQVDPVQMLLDEYSRLEEKATPKPMYSPEQRQQRVDSNDEMTQLGLLGQMSGDRQAQQVGGGVLKQALADRSERVSARGTMNPLTGEEHISPEYQAQQAENRRGQILQKALGFQQQRDMQSQRAVQQRQHDEFMQQLRVKIQDMKNDGGGGGGGHNLQKITDETTGQQFWADPRTGQAVKPVTVPGGTEMAPKPNKMTGPDEKALSDVVRGAAAVASALDSVKQRPNAFSMSKGAPQMLPGALGQVAQAVRDKSMAPEDVAARAMVYNNISQIIKERAGTAQSVGEMKRLNSFLPNDLDNAPAITAKFTAFQQYLAEQGAAIQGRYKGPRPTLHADPGAGVQTPGETNQGGTPPPNPATVQPGSGAKKRMRFNPATGELE